jgi:hypothetical protein
MFNVNFKLINVIFKVNFRIKYFTLIENRSFHIPIKINEIASN